MPRPRRKQLNNSAVTLDKAIRDAVENLIEPYRIDVNAIRKDAVRLGKKLEALALRIAREAAGRGRGQAKRFRGGRWLPGRRARSKISRVWRKR